MLFQARPASLTGRAGLSQLQRSAVSIWHGFLVLTPGSTWVTSAIQGEPGSSVRSAPSARNSASSPHAIGLSRSVAPGCRRNHFRSDRIAATADLPAGQDALWVNLPSPIAVPQSGHLGGLGSSCNSLSFADGGIRLPPSRRCIIETRVRSSPGSSPETNGRHPASFRRHDRGYQPQKRKRREGLVTFPPFPSGLNYISVPFNVGICNLRGTC
jgi:hypothetical protein